MSDRPVAAVVKERGNRAAPVKIPVRGIKLAFWDVLFWSSCHALAHFKHFKHFEPDFYLPVTESNRFFLRTIRFPSHDGLH